MTLKLMTLRARSVPLITPIVIFVIVTRVLVITIAAKIAAAAFIQSQTLFATIAKDEDSIIGAINVDGTCVSSVTSGGWS